MENISESGEAMILESWKSGKPEGEREVRASSRAFLPSDFSESGGNMI